MRTTRYLRYRWAGATLALNSGVAVSNASYKIHAYRLSENLVSGNTYILTIWGILGAGRECFSIWIGGGYTSLGPPRSGN